MNNKQRIKRAWETATTSVTMDLFYKIGFWCFLVQSIIAFYFLITGIIFTINNLELVYILDIIYKTGSLIFQIALTLLFYGMIKNSSNALNTNEMISILEEEK